LIDVAAEKTRIAKDISKAEKEISTLERKLGNADFLAKAPEDVVSEQRARLAEEQSRRQRLADALATLSVGGAAWAGEPARARAARPPADRSRGYRAAAPRSSWSISRIACCRPCPRPRRPPCFATQRS